MPHLSFLLWAGILMSILILAHELAHLAVALAAGVKVEVFSLGFGPRLWGFQIYGIDFRVSAFPLGGYVRMFGESGTDPNQKTALRSFQSKSRLRRALILVAGPAMNCLLAVAVFTGLYCHGFFDLAPIAEKNRSLCVGLVLPNSPAAEAGLQPGDTVLRVNNHSVFNPADTVPIIRNSQGTLLHFLVDRTGTQRTIVVRPRQVQNAATTIWQIGASFQRPVTKVKFPLHRAVPHAVWTTMHLTRDILETAAGICRGQVAPSSLLGPIGIAQISGQAAAQGILMFLALLGIMSLNLGLVNLLPIPVLDGGSLALLLIESLAGRDLSPKLKNNITKTGFALVFGLMAMVTFNDVVRVFLTTTTKR